METSRREQQSRQEKQEGISKNHFSPSADAVIIVAAGASQRFGEDKLMVLLQGRPLISYSLQTFLDLPSIAEIILVVTLGREAVFAALDLPGLDRKIKIVPGGKNRHESVQRGLESLSSNIEWVAIHDGARPLVSRSMMELIFQKAREHGAATLAAPVVDTLHRASPDQVAETTVDRTHLWAMQTPQVFRKADLMSLPSWKENKNFTDEVSAFLQCGKKVYLVENREPNIKVTYPADLKIVSALLSVSRKQ